MPIVKLRTFNYQRAKLHGLKVPLRTALMYWGIERRSRVKITNDHAAYFPLDIWGYDYYKAVHTERQFSETFGNLSFSSTTADGADGCRFKLIEYSHPEYWDTVEREVTRDQELSMFLKACKMADVQVREITELVEWDVIRPDAIVQGPNHTRYDHYMPIAFINQRVIWKVSETKRHCTRAVCEVDCAGGLHDCECDEVMPAQYHVAELKRKEGEK